MIVESCGDGGWSCDCTPRANSRLAHGLTSALPCGQALYMPECMHRATRPSPIAHVWLLSLTTFNFHMNLTLIRPLEEPDIAGCPCTLGLGVC